MAVVLIPSILLEHTQYQERLSFTGDSLLAVMTNLTKKHPGLSPYIFDQSGNFCNFISMYLNNKDVRFLQGKNTSTHEEDVLTIVPALAGG